MVTDILETAEEQLGTNAHEGHHDAEAAQVADAAHDHVWVHTLTWNEYEHGGLHVFDHAEGSTIWDVNGKAYLDGIAGLWVVNAGHGRAEIAEAMGRQAARLGYANAMNYTSTPTALLGEKLAALTPGDLNRVFFSSGGSEAVETALKIAKQVQAMRGFARRYKVIGRRGSYHGQTMGALSLTHAKNEHWFGPFMYGVSHVPHPDRYRSDFGLEGEAADVMAAKFVEQEIVAQGPDTVAAVIAEPISIAAGVHVPSKVYWQMLREITQKHGVLLIADEVINGFGRTGTMFAIEQYGIVPDIMTLAKGITSGYAPLAATVVSDSVYEVFQQQPSIPMGHLLTFGGHPVSCAASLKNIEIFEQEDLVKRGAETGAYLKSQLDELRSHPSVGDVRGTGMVYGLDLVTNKETRAKIAKDGAFSKRMNELMMERGLITRLWDILHLAPPLVITRDEVDRMVAIVDESLTIAERENASDFTA
ncbi:MAG: aspartate aminotransferase family protein [Thermomicrobiales bacterium]|nr:aspartate aminotransferase family protein [Thermomicrobiales bacterium]